MDSDTLMIILSVLLTILGTGFSISPIIPGVVISYTGLLVYYFTPATEMPTLSIVIWGVLMLVASLLDNILAPYFTKKFGGSKSATRGSFIGLIIGAFFFPPFGMVLGAFIGALIGEYRISNTITDKELKIAFGSFIGLLLSSGAKLIFCVSTIIYLIIAITRLL